MDKLSTYDVKWFDKKGNRAEGWYVEEHSADHGLMIHGPYAEAVAAALATKWYNEARDIPQTSVILAM